MKFLDPACGSGNFLTETYLSLRRLENEILGELRALNADIPDNPIKITPAQFFGIEINDFAVAVAKLALWIAEIQMLRKTSWIIGRELQELPLRKNISIVKANALCRDWGLGTRNEELGTRDIVENSELVPSSSKLVPTWTFAKLYNEETMPKALRAAHKANDYAVALAYGFEDFLEDEPRIVAELMKRYKAMRNA